MNILSDQIALSVALLIILKTLQRSVFVVSGRKGSGKSTVISKILRTHNLSATSVAFCDLHSLTGNSLCYLVTYCSLLSHVF